MQRLSTVEIFVEELDTCLRFEGKAFHFRILDQSDSAIV
jgi:hypothetical protein